MSRALVEWPPLFCTNINFLAPPSVVFSESTPKSVSKPTMPHMNTFSYGKCAKRKQRWALDSDAADAPAFFPFHLFAKLRQMSNPVTVWNASTFIHRDPWINAAAFGRCSYQKECSIPAGIPIWKHLMLSLLNPGRLRENLLIVVS